MVGLGKAALAKGYKRMMVIAEDYAFPYSQVQGFMAEYCAKPAARCRRRPGCRWAARTTRR